MKLKYLNILFCCAALLVAGQLSSQNPNIQYAFELEFPTSGFYEEQEVQSIAVDGENTYLLKRTPISNGSSNGLTYETHLFKIDKYGNVLVAKFLSIESRIIQLKIANNEVHLWGNDGEGSQYTPSSKYHLYRFDLDLNEIGKRTLSFGNVDIISMDFSFYNGHYYAISRGLIFNLVISKLDLDLNPVWMKKINHGLAEGSTFGDRDIYNDVSINASADGIYFSFNSDDYGNLSNAVLGKAGLNFGFIYWLKNLDNKPGIPANFYTDVIGTYGNSLYVLGGEKNIFST